MSGIGEPEQTVEDEDLNLQNHFSWDLENLRDWSQVTEYLEYQRKQFNSLRPHKTLKRFRIGLLMSYLMFKHDIEGWLNCLDNAILTMEHTRQPTAQNPLTNFPTLDSPLWKGPFENFLAYLSDLEAGSGQYPEQNSIDADADKKEESWNSFERLYISAEHIAFSLKATMWIKKGSPESAKTLWEKVVPIDEMSKSEKAGVYYIKAGTFRLCGSEGLVRSIDFLRKTVLLDPDKLLWTLKLITYKGMVRHVNGWGTAKWSEVEDVIKVADAVLQLELEDWMRVKFQYEKFQAIQDFIRDPGKRYTLPTGTRFALYKDCEELVQAIVATTKDNWMLAHCAMFRAKDERGIAQAVDIIDAVLENDPLNPYTNSKAVTIYNKANQLDKALHCAEIAANHSVGTYMQLLTLKIQFGHSLDLEEFISTGLHKFQQVDEVRRIHMNAFIHYTSLTNHFKRAIFHFKNVLDSEPIEEFFRFYNKLINSMIHAGEAAYNVIMYVMSGDKSYFDVEYIEGKDTKLFMEVKECIEERFDVECFGSHYSTPKEYLEWFKTKRDPKDQFHRFTEAHSHTQKAEQRKWPGQQNNATLDNVYKHRMDRFGESAGSLENNGNQNQTTGDFGYLKSRTHASTYYKLSSSRGWHSRPFPTNKSNSSNANPRHSNPFENWRSHSGATGSNSSGRWHTKNTSEPRYKSNFNDWRARDDA